jgi:hypothetical protein
MGIKNIPTFSILRPTKIYSNSDFWLEKEPSGNPAFYLIDGKESCLVSGEKAINGLVPTLNGCFSEKMTFLKTFEVA